MSYFFPNFYGYGPRLLSGAWLMLELAILALLLAIVLGLITAMAKLSQIKIIKIIATLYTTIVRAIPDLVLMLLLFYGGQILLNQFTDALAQWTNNRLNWFINLDAFTAGVITLAVIFGAYMAETFRGAFLAIDFGQLQAARAYGLTFWQRFRFVQFPLMMRHALPGLGNNWLVLLKTTALVSLIGLSDIMYVGNEATKATQQPFLFMIPIALSYLFIASLSQLVIYWLTKCYTIGFTEDH